MEMIINQWSSSLFNLFLSSKCIQNDMEKKCILMLGLLHVKLHVLLFLYTACVTSQKLFTSNFSQQYPWTI